MNFVWYFCCCAPTPFVVRVYVLVCLFSVCDLWIKNKSLIDVDSLFAFELIGRHSP